MDSLYINLMSRLSEAKETSSERGAAGVEYGILVAAIAAVIVGVAVTLGGEIQTAFTTVVNAI